MNQIKNILYLGWLGKANVGDDVLFELFKTMFYRYHKSKDESIVNIDAHPSINNYKIEYSNYDLIVLGGGSLINHPIYLNACLEGINNGIPVVSWGTGLDGAFRREHLNTINLNPENAGQFKAIYEKFEYISVRGPFTRNMLNNIGVKKTIHEVGDPALAYAKEIFGDQLTKGESNKNILVNWGTSYNNIFGNNEMKVEQELVHTIHKLISLGYKITVYPIWTEDIEPVKRLVRKVNNKNCQAITEVYEAKILQVMISQFYMSINLKLHANILSASVDLPFISLAYRGKCFDFAESVNCVKYAIATDEVTSEGILELVNDIEYNYNYIVQAITKAKNRYYPELIKSIYKISEILNNQTSKEVQLTNSKLLNSTILQHSGDSKIINMSMDLIETILEGLEHIQKLIAQSKLEQSIYLFDDICEAFLVIENSIKEILESLNNDVINENLELIKNTLDLSVSAYEESNIVQLENILLSELKMNFEQLYECLKDIGMSYIN